MSNEVKFNEGETAEVKGSPSLSAPIKPSIPESLILEQPNKAAKKDPKAFVKMFNKAGKIAVKPFVDQNQENMGLEAYGMALFPGVHHEEQLAAIERNGVVRYITGLDEFAPEVQNINDDDQRQAVIFNIRSVVAYLEQMLATNVLKVEDEDFWNKVKLLRPDNFDFWGKISVRCGNEALTLEPGKDPYDLIKFMAIEAGGFDLVAKSFDDANARPVAPKFFLDKEVHTVSHRTSYKKLRNKAIGKLDIMSNKNFKKLMYVTKIIDSNSISFKNSTPGDVLYDVCDDYINGLGAEPNKTKAAEYFTETATLDMETLKLKALVKDASFYKIISLKADGMLYHTKSSIMLGRNVSDVVTYFKNPLNEDVLIKVLAEVENYWNA
jgi:hypothetical protein